MTIIQVDYFDVIKEISYIQQKRLSLGSGKKSREYKEKEPNFALIKIHLGDVEFASTTIEINVDGKKLEGPFQILKRFKDREEVIKYAKKNGVKIILS